MNKSLQILDQILRILIARTIGFYQKYISPYKGFSCAHRRLYGGESCSQYAKRIVLEEGVVIAWQKLTDRFRECKEASLILKSKRASIEEESERRKSKPRRPEDLQKDQDVCIVILDGCSNFVCPFIFEGCLSAIGAGTIGGGCF